MTKITSNTHLNIKQLENYLAGGLDVSAMHQVEKHLLECSFCADTLEGLKVMPQQKILLTTNADLKKKLNLRIQKNQKKHFLSVWQSIGIAASILILVSISTYLFYQNDKQKQEISLKKENSILVDSMSILQNELGMLKEEANPNNEVDNKIIEPQITKPIEKADEIAKLEDREESIQELPPMAEEQSEKRLPVAIEAEPSPSAKSKEMSMDKKAMPNADMKSITGIVKNENGEVLPGVTVKIKGQNKGTQTDQNGKFELRNIQKGEILEFDFVGMDTQKIVVENPQQPISVTLTNGSMTLAEVVVSGYDARNEEDENLTETHAEPAMGWKAFRKYLKQELKYPAQAAEKGIHGRVIANITLLNGEIQNIEIIKKLGYGCDEEAIRLLQNTKWKASKTKTSIKISVAFGK